MKKLIWILAIVIVIIGSLVYYRGQDKASTGKVENVRAEVAEAKGTIGNVDTSQIAFDGPALITINKADGTKAIVSVPSMGINLCAAKDNIADVSTLKAGDKVEARGAVGEDGSITPCESAEHFLRIAQ